MALFSRRPKKPAEPSPSTPADEPETAPVPEAARTQSDGTTDASTPPIPAEPSPTEPVAESPAEPSPVEPAADAAPSVNISVSTYGGLGAAPRTSAASSAPQAQQAPDEATPQQAPAAQPRVGTREWMRTAPEPTETIPGLRDNVLLRAALGRVGDAPPSQAMLDVMRQLMQGHVFLRVKGDARTLLAEGKGLPLAVATAGERTFALVYSSGAALQASLKADGDADTSAMGQPVLTVLNHVIASAYDGIIIDPASGASRAVLPKELLKRAVEQADPQLTVKTLLAAERTDDIPAKIAQALAHVPLWVAVGSAEGGMPGLAEGRTEDGSRYLEVYSHPLEVAVMGRGDNAGPITGAQLARALRSEPQLTGIVVDPAGPWIRLSRDDLAPLLALAE
jgi:hypothetical protein